MARNINNNLIIELHVPDFEMVKKFYSVLGFKLNKENPTGEEMGYMTMTRKDELGDTLLNFYGGDERVSNQAFFKQFPKTTPRGYGCSVTIPVDDIDTLYQKVKSEMMESLEQELIDKQDGDVRWRDFRMVDPFGFYLRFTELIDWGQ